MNLHLFPAYSLETGFFFKKETLRVNALKQP